MVSLSYMVYAGEEIKLQEIMNDLIKTQMHISPRILIVLLFIIVEIKN